MKPYINFDVALPMPDPSSSDEEIAEFVRAKATTTWHYSCTTRMGPIGDKSCVCDPAGRVQGVQGLRVADAGIMPFVVSGNTNAASVMIGDRVGYLIASDFVASTKDFELPKSRLSAIVPSCPLRIPSYVASDSKPLADGTTRVRLAMSRLPGIPLDTYVAEPPEAFGFAETEVRSPTEWRNLHRNRSAMVKRWPSRDQGPAAKRQKSETVSFLLFADGRADPEEWRPNADESMWWGRRDAVVRITAAALWPTSEGGAAQCTVLLAGDNSLLSMDSRLKECAKFGNQGPGNTAPTEQDLVRSWRRAVAGTGAIGAACVKELLDMDPWKQSQALSGEPGDAGAESLDRRELLRHLQSTGSLEFLRAHGLNKKPERLLKTATKAQLLSALEQLPKPGGGAPGAVRGDHHPELRGAIRRALQAMPPQTAVVVLHEDCSHELRLFSAGRRDSEPQPTDLQHGLFVLGAVRDMTSVELAVVEDAAKEMDLKLVRCRIGSTAEFTSKVVRCVTAAHSHGLVLPSLRSLFAAPSPSDPEPRKVTAPMLAFTVLADFLGTADQVTTDRASRPRMVPLLQLCVCTLWRSKIGDKLASDEGGTCSSKLRDVCQTRRMEPQLRLLFSDDGDSVLLGTKFVEGLSKSHKAAPTEFQLLEALRDRCSRRRGGTDSLWKRELRRSLKSWATDTQDAIAILLCTDAEADAHDLFSEIQASGKWKPKQLLLLIASTTAGRQSAANACAEMGLILVPVRLAGGSAPSAATLLQFMHYCDELLPALRPARRRAIARQGHEEKAAASSVCSVLVYHCTRKMDGELAYAEVILEVLTSGPVHFDNMPAQRGTYMKSIPIVENRLRTAVAFARALVEQLAPTMASISSVAYHRDVNAHNILVDVDAAGLPTHSLVDFGLAVNASTWMDPSPKNPGGKSEWEFLDVGGDCRYWPVSAWRQFEAGCRALSEAPALCAEYQTHLDLQGLGLTVLQVLVAMLPEEGLVLRELRTLQDAWSQYWDDATEFWSALLNTFRHGGDWSALKQEFVARGVHRVMAQRLKKLHDALNTALSAAAAANLDEEGTSDWPHGSAGLLWALLAMVSYGEERTEPAHWGEVTMRLGRSEPRQYGDMRAPAAARSRMKPAPPERVGNLTEAPRLLEYLNKLRDLTGKVNELSQDFRKLTAFHADVAES
eukprot:s1079_g2.t2